MIKEQKQMMLRQVGIVGLGLIGGSLAKAIRRHGLAEFIAAVDADRRALDRALSEGIIDQADTECGLLKQADIIFLCVPVLLAPAYLKKLTKTVHSQAIITDTGSTKSGIVATAEQLCIEHRFVGGHPMAGSEKSGYSASAGNLFENAYYILCENESNRDACGRVHALIRRIGALPMLLDAEQHDEIVGMVSHVPHVVASALVNAAAQSDEPAMRLLAAGGFKDITRIASSSPQVWRDICQANEANIAKGLQSVINQISRFQAVLARGEETEKQFIQAKQFRDGLADNRKSLLPRVFRITVDVEDRPGIIAEISGILAMKEINISNIGINNSREMEEGILEICFYDSESRDSSYAVLSAVGYRVFK